MTEQQIQKHRDWQRKHYQENKAYISQIRKNNYSSTKIKQQEYKKKYTKTVSYKFITYRKGAKIRNLEFNLDLDYFKNNWNKKCYYCGDDINGIGLDRIDSLKGYTSDNVVNCCTICNRMKLNYTTNFFIEHCKKIYNNN